MKAPKRPSDFRAKTKLLASGLYREAELYRYLNAVPIDDELLANSIEYILPLSVDQVWTLLFDKPYSWDNVLQDTKQIVLNKKENWSDSDLNGVLKKRKTFWTVKNDSSLLMKIAQGIVY